MSSPSNILILGGGIAGVAAALALTIDNAKTKSIKNLRVQIFEIRPALATIGGAVNLTPNAMRYLHHLGATARLLPRSCDVPRIDIFAHRTGKKLSDIDYSNIERFKFHGRRVLRSVLLQALVDTLESDHGIKIQYGKKASKIINSPGAVEVSFEDGTTAKGDVLLGCDGIHSFVRTTVVEPARKPIYSGIAGAYGLMPSGAPPASSFPFTSTGMYSGRKGSFLFSYFDEARTQLYVAAVMETPSAESRDGWKVKSADRAALKSNILERFGGSPQPLIDQVVAAVDEWYLFPVFKLSPKGKWREGRCLLLGDAAHAMPPQGESIGIALEDAMVLSKIVTSRPSDSLEDLFAAYEKVRRAPVEAAHEEASWRWESVKDKGWLAGVMMEWFTGLFLWWTKAKRDEGLASDVRDFDLSN